jgi:hypothetical protein
VAVGSRRAPSPHWQYVLRDDGLQLMQYELTIYCRRTPGLEWLADWQYARYIAAVTEVLGAAAEHDTAAPSAISLDQLTRFLVAAVDGLVLQYTVHHDAEQSRHDIFNLITAGAALARGDPGPGLRATGAKRRTSPADRCDDGPVRGMRPCLAAAPRRSRHRA